MQARLREELFPFFIVPNKRKIYPKLFHVKIRFWKTSGAEFLS